jgi:hypothetical protein
MNFKLQRLTHDKNQTFGMVTGEGYQAWSLEDEPRQVKVKGETRIPAGTYQLTIRKEDTPLTIKHRQDYNKLGNIWFSYHIEVSNVPNFSGVYVHTGNDQGHTEGCLLFGDTLTITGTINPLTQSTKAVERFYRLVYPELEKNNEVLIEIKDEI